MFRCFLKQFFNKTKNLIYFNCCERLFSVSQKSVSWLMRRAKHAFKRKPWHLTRVSRKFENDKSVQISNEFAINLVCFYHPLPLMIQITLHHKILICTWDLSCTWKKREEKQSRPMLSWTKELKTSQQKNHYVLFKGSCLDPRMDYIRPKSDMVKVIIA